MHPEEPPQTAPPLQPEVSSGGGCSLPLTKAQLPWLLGIYAAGEAIESTVVL